MFLRQGVKWILYLVVQDMEIQEKKFGTTDIIQPNYIGKNIMTCMPDLKKAIQMILMVKNMNIIIKSTHVGTVFMQIFVLLAFILLNI